MKKNKKLLVLVALFLAVFAVGGTLAYLTDTTETKTNTFTFGKVDITLTEPNWNTTTAGDIVPGQQVAKDPTITVESDSKNAYVFAKVTLPTGTVGTQSDQPLFAIDALGTGWVEVTTGVTLGANEHLYAYGTASAMTSVAKNTTLPAVFTSVTANAGLTEANITALTTPSARSANIVVTAYAIQAEGLSNNGAAITAPADVWTAAGF